MDTIYRLYKNVGLNDSKDLLEAVMKNDCSYVIDAFESGVDVFYQDTKGDTLLHKACRNNYFEMIDLLLKLGIPIQTKNKYFDTPLHLAVQYKNEDVVEKLLFEGANPNCQNRNKVSPLHLAASRGKESVLNALISRGAKINLADNNGAKPIHYAIKSGRKEMIRTLLNSGASLLECDDRKDNVLHYACKKGDDELVAYILRHMTIINARNIFGDTALHLASASCSSSTIKLLIEAGYHVEEKNRNNQTPADVARTNNKTENYEYLQRYMQSAEFESRRQRFPIHYAIKRHNDKYLEEFVHSGNIHSMDCFGKSLMYYAITENSLKMVEFLYSKGARIDIIDDENHSALLIAIYVEDLEIIRFLLEQKANINEIIYGRSHLYRAILRNNYDLVKTLIDYGANVNYIDNRHRTLYSYAIEYADDDIIDLLVSKKASLL